MWMSGGGVWGGESTCMCVCVCVFLSMLHDVCVYLCRATCFMFQLQLENVCHGGSKSVCVCFPTFFSMHRGTAESCFSTVGT